MNDDASTDATTTVAATVDLQGIEERLREQLDRAHRQLVEFESTLTGMQRDGTILEDREATRLVIDAIRADVRQIDRALGRFADGSYGRCVTCGADIPAERLEAIPTVDHCARCA